MELWQIQAMLRLEGYPSRFIYSVKVGDNRVVSLKNPVTGEIENIQVTIIENKKQVKE